MKEWKGDLSKLPANQTEFDAICITTNGLVKNDGRCVMGAGIAKQFRNKVKNIDLKLGGYIKKYGNRCFILQKWNNAMLCSFVVKDNWFEMAKIELIIKSIEETKLMADKYGFKSIALPRPGCGNGSLDWEEVKKVIEPLLDERFVICHFE